MLSFCFLKISEHDGKGHVFLASNGEHFEVSSFEDGIATIEPIYMAHITDICKMIEDCFNEDSNFIYELLASYDSKDKFKGIEFEFNGVTVLVTKENADKDKIYSMWNEMMERKYSESANQHSLIVSPSELKQRYRKSVLKNKFEKVSKDTQMEFKNSAAKEGWENWLKFCSSDTYGPLVTDFASNWAKYMQYIMKKHNKSIFDIADSTKYIFDINNISGFQYAQAIAALSAYWKYGDELRIWHNKRYVGEKEVTYVDGIINPSIICVLPSLL